MYKITKFCALITMEIFLSQFSGNNGGEMVSCQAMYQILIYNHENCERKIRAINAILNNIIQLERELTSS